MDKAQAKFLDFVLATLLSIIVLISIYSLSLSLYRNWLSSEIRSELEYLSLKLSSEMVKAYELAQKSYAEPANYSSFLLYEAELSFPESIKGRSYEIFLVNPNPIWVSISNVSLEGKELEARIESGGIKIVAKTLQDPRIEVELSVPNLNTLAEGKIVNGKDSKLRYYRLNLNGKVLDVVLIGNYNILAEITNIK